MLEVTRLENGSQTAPGCSHPATQIVTGAAVGGPGGGVTG